jgi:hypothetical protein
MEVRQTRHQEIKLIKYDDPFTNIRYTGRSSSMRGLDSEPIWQIMREYKVCATGVTVETHANMGEFNCVWDNRTTYFPVAIGDNACPLGAPINATISGTIATTPSGLRIQGKHSFVSVNSTSWTKIPAIPLIDRNGMSIQNESGIDVRIRYLEGIGDLTWRGSLISGNNGDRFYNIKDTIEIYAKSASGTPELIIEEIS